MRWWRSTSALSATASNCIPLDALDAPYSWAQSYANMNNDYLGGLGIYSRVRGIRINDVRDTVYVAVSYEAL